MTAGLVLAGILAALLAGVRLRAYRRHLGYDPRRSYSHRLDGAQIEAVAVRLGAAGFELSPLAAGAAGGLLEIELRATLAGRWIDPYVEISAHGERSRQYFERGARGLRFLSLSRFLRDPARGGVVALRGVGLRWTQGWVRLHLCRERLAAGERVLVVAPHPDDAEIAAYGVYGAANAAVVTLSAGDGAGDYPEAGNPHSAFPRETVARLRVWDSITIPLLNGVSVRDAVNLCYPDGHLAKMSADPGRDLNDGTRRAAFAVLRRMNLSPAMPPERDAISWNGLVEDLAHLLREMKPDVIVAPYPFHDPHPDHGYATVAVCDALPRAGGKAPRFYLYLNHLRLTQLYPFGPQGGGVTLPPAFGGEDIACGGFVSQPLTPAEQAGKHLALEANHDLRDIRPLRAMRWPAILRRLRSEVHALIHGMGNPPTSRFRRAVRSEEFFFVLPAAEVAQLAARFRKQDNVPPAGFAARG